MSSTSSLFAAHALLPAGWARDVQLVWDAGGMLTEVRAGTQPDPSSRHATGPVLPGMPNLHSHAFQRAFAGLTEFRPAAASGADSFWTWRDVMYRFALAVSPEQLETIATQLYIEMLQAGYTSVCEFHYLHHTASGVPFDAPAEMALRLVSAAKRVGMGMTLLPVLYQDAGFGGRPPRDDQRRFINSVDALLDLVRRCAECGVRVGAAPHSLRAVSPHAMSDLLEGLREIDPGAPVHIHIAEQQAEVDDCVAWSGARPVQWLLDNAPVDERWCLVHATHMTAVESQRVAARGAVIGLCPSTEANLGDGVFDAPPYLAANGRWGVGSDSHASVSVVDELRLLEYSQRLTQQRRNVFASTQQAGVAERLWLAAADGGARAAAQPIGALAVGRSADLIVLDATGVHAGLTPPHMLANSVFAQTGQRAVRDVWVAGQPRVVNGRHALEADAQAAFVAARCELLAQA